MQNYKINEYSYQSLKDRIQLPKFQRSLVWKQENKEWFIETVLAGDPFGIMMLYNNPLTNEKQLIDGLQRYSTLQEFERKPFNFIKIDEVKFPQIKDIAEYIQNVYQLLDIDSIIKIVTEIVKDVFSNNKQDDLRGYRVFEKLVLKEIDKTYPELLGKQEYLHIGNEVGRLWENIEKTITISHVTIPVIIYHGAEENLPDIFERLNRGGTSLTKYEVFASSWSNIRIKNIDKQIAEIIEKRYSEVIEKTQMQIDNFQEGDILANREISLYEYCFALGKLIKERSPKLFNSASRKDDSVDSIGFSVLCSVLGMHLKDMAKLKTKIHSKIPSKNINRLTDSILTVFSNIEEIMSVYTGHYTKYVEAQVISLFCTYFKLKFDLNVDTLELTPIQSEKRMFDLFRLHAPFRFFNDIIRNFWAGSGDNKLFDIINTPIINNRYLTPIAVDTWKIHLQDWMNEQLNKTTRSISAETKLFIAYIASPYINNEEMKEYQMNQIIPKQTLKSHLVSSGISHVGNIYLMHKKLKKNKSLLLLGSLNQHYKDLVFNYPNDDEFLFLTGRHVTEDYVQFLEHRTQDLIDSFTALLSGW